MKIKLIHTYKDIISLENLICAWGQFLVGKKSKPDVEKFGMYLMDNIIALQISLANKTYVHGGYYSFNITDPKPRHIHKASVQDRLLHHAVYRLTYPFFDRTFIADSYSCRLGKGTHRAMKRFEQMAASVSKNHTRTCYVLKCDIRKFFASIDHEILSAILKEYIPDQDSMWLFENIIGSFRTNPERAIGLPLGNLTSQLLGNVYMNVFDQWMKHSLKQKNYIRYADDFVFFHHDKKYLESLIPQIGEFLSRKLRLTLHPDKLCIKTVASGVDFLGWVHFTDHRILRRTTKKRMFLKIQKNPEEDTVQSYLGLLQYGNTFKLQQSVLNDYWLWQ